MELKKSIVKKILNQLGLIFQTNDPDLYIRIIQYKENPKKKNHEDKFWLTKMLSDEIEKESFNKKRIQNKTNGIQ